MEYSDRGRSERRRRDTSSSGGRRSTPSGSGGRQRIRPKGPYHGPRGVGGRSNPSLGASFRSGSRGGYPLRTRNINFQGRRRGRLTGNMRLVLMGALALVLLVLVVVGVSSCVRGCTPADEAQTQDVNAVDARVAKGVSEDLTRQFAAELDRGEALKQIAANADKYSDQGLLELALAEPTAVDFVAAYPDAKKEAKSYDDAVSKGTAPELYCWDERWGNVDYNGRALALTGSGPTALAMARMGLLGNADQTPATVAEAVTKAGQATGDSGMGADYVLNNAADLGLEAKTYAAGADTLSQVLDAGTYILIEAKAGTLTGSAHWVLLVTEHNDGSVVVYDPTSPEVSAHSWSPATLAASCESLIGVSAAASDSGSDAA